MKAYEEPRMELIRLDCGDLIATSCGGAAAGGVVDSVSVEADAPGC